MEIDKIQEIESKTQAQAITEVAAELKKAFGIIAQDVQKIARLIGLSFKRTVELTVFEIRKRHIVKRQDTRNRRWRF